MRLSISETRRKLPALVKLVQADPNTVVKISLRKESVAELRSKERAPKPGTAARRLLAMRRRLATRRGVRQPPPDPAGAKNAIYGPEGVVR